MKQTNTNKILNQAAELLRPSGLEAVLLQSSGLAALAPADTTLTDAAVRAIVRNAYTAANIPIRLPMPSIDLHRQYWAFAIPITLL